MLLIRMCSHYTCTRSQLFRNFCLCFMRRWHPWPSYQKRKIEGCAFLGTSSPPPRISDPCMHHTTCAKHAPWCMQGSLTTGFLWSRWRGKRSRHSWHNPQFYASGKRPMLTHGLDIVCQFTEFVNPVQICIALDAPLFALAKDIQWN